MKMRAMLVAVVLSACSGDDGGNDTGDDTGVGEFVECDNEGVFAGSDECEVPCTLEGGFEANLFGTCTATNSEGQQILCEAAPPPGPWKQPGVSSTLEQFGCCAGGPASDVRVRWYACEE